MFCISVDGGGLTPVVGELGEGVDAGYLTTPDKGLYDIRRGERPLIRVVR